MHRWITTLVLLLVAGVVQAENIDPSNDDSQRAWGENIGWINAEPSGNGGPGVTVGDTTLDGYMWSENGGWISLSCSNTGSCLTTDYGVTNDYCGDLSGYAWSENLGWISFSCENNGDCGAADYGVSIDPMTGEFSGFAWSENAGWISFASNGANPHKVTTGWTASPPAATPSLLIGKMSNFMFLNWSAVQGASEYQLYRGDLNGLISTGGDFAATVDQCTTTTGSSTPLLLATGPDVEYFLVRAVNCAGRTTADSGGAGQVGLRDTEIALSPNDCPGF